MLMLRETGVESEIKTFPCCCRFYTEGSSKRAVGKVQLRVMTKIISRELIAYLLEHLGGRLISGISPPEVLEVIMKIEVRDARETARRILRIASAVFRYGIATGRCAQDPTVALQGALRPPKSVKHRATLTARDLPKFLRDLAQYQGTAHWSRRFVARRPQIWPTPWRDGALWIGESSHSTPPVGVSSVRR